MSAASNTAVPDSAFPKPPLLTIKKLSKAYTQKRWFSWQQRTVDALQEIDLTISAGSTFAVVGESGSGKSTLARCLAMFERPDEGDILFQGRSLLSMPTAERRKLRPAIQLLFQDAATSFNPQFSALEAVLEPLVIQNVGSKREQLQRVRELMEQVGVSPDGGNRSIMEFSGGQKQRIAIARALALQPQLLILDEALSGLDLSMQGQILELLANLQRGYALTYLLISHDLALVGEIADQVAVLHEGRVIEHAAPPTLFAQPQHQQTQALVRAVPLLETAYVAGGS
ncbi:MAG: ATP-binding cassette domain-containing protein [Acidobacteriales bacterium]|nr:ATP-binding cassette domain-containing protein [Terriglobales bacterium]